MIRNFFTLAYRHFVRSPLSSFIELAGLTVAFTLLIAFLTIGWGSWKASNQNPAKLIKYE